MLAQGDQLAADPARVPGAEAHSLGRDSGDENTGRAVAGGQAPPGAAAGPDLLKVHGVAAARVLIPAQAHEGLPVRAVPLPRPVQEGRDNVAGFVDDRLDSLVVTGLRPEGLR